MVGTKLIGTLLFAIIPSVVYGLSACPFYRPHAYYGGAYCCQYAQEKSSGYHRPLRLDSTNCKDDSYIKCPNGNDCRSISRETCYFDGEKLDNLNAKEDCLEIVFEDGEYEVEWVHEVIELEGWRVYEECTKGGGQPEKCEVSPSGSVGSSTLFTSPTAGQRRALARAPSGNRCNPPRRWRSVRGKRKCRRSRKSG